MKKLQITLLILLISSSLLSQDSASNASVLWGSVFKEVKKSKLKDIVGYDESGIYVSRVRKSGAVILKENIILEHFNQEMTKTNSQEIDLKAKGQKMDFERFINTNNSLYLFSSFKNKKLKKKILFAQTINKKSLQPNGDLKKVAAIDYSGKWELGYGDFKYSFSRDSSKILVYHQMPHQIGGNEKYGFNVYDQQLNPLWEKEVELPYKDKLFDVVDYVVSNQGDVYLLGLVFNEKRRVERKGKVNYRFEILEYAQNGEAALNYPVQVNEKYLLDMNIFIDAQNDIVCTGFYSDEDLEEYSIKGSFFLKVDGEAKAIAMQNFKPFEMDFITQTLSEREAKWAQREAERGENVELSDYNLRTIVSRGNGGVLLIAEQYEVERSTITSEETLTSTTSTAHFYNDIILIYYNTSGEIAWSKVIRKGQFTQNDEGYYSSYATAIVQDKLYLVFNDNPKNIPFNDTEEPEYFRGKKNSIAVLVEIDWDGNTSRKKLFDAKEFGVMMAPQFNAQVADQELILFGKRGKKERFAKVQFEE